LKIGANGAGKTKKRRSQKTHNLRGKKSKTTPTISSATEKVKREKTSTSSSTGWHSALHVTHRNAGKSEAERKKLKQTLEEGKSPPGH